MAAPSFFNSPPNCAFSANKRNQTLPWCPPLCFLSWAPPTASMLTTRRIESSRASSLVSLPPVLRPLIHFYNMARFLKEILTILLSLQWFPSSIRAKFKFSIVNKHDLVPKDHSSLIIPHPPVPSYSTALLDWATCGFRKALSSLTLFLPPKCSFSSLFTWPVFTHLWVSAGAFA